MVEGWLAEGDKLKRVGEQRDGVGEVFEENIGEERPNEVRIGVYVIGGGEEGSEEIDGVEGVARAGSKVREVREVEGERGASLLVGVEG